MTGRYVRTLEDSQLVISHAKIDENDIKPITQHLYFSDRSDVFGKFRFIELEPSLLDLLQKGDKLKFCGSKDVNAVLCTKSKTYEVKEAETSNSLLLLPSLKWSADIDNESTRQLEEKKVYGIFHKYLELRPCLPNLLKLHEMLNHNVYMGPEKERNIEEKENLSYTFEQLLSNVQASEDELLQALKEETACCINGNWRMLDLKYHLRVLKLILGVVDENSWSNDSVVKEEVLDALKDIVPLEILTQVFDWYTEPFDSVDHKEVYKLQEGKILRFMGQVLLIDVKGISLEDFMTIWESVAPPGMDVNISYMDGLILIKKVNDKELIYYFPESDLPSNISGRFSVLFETREKWTYEEIYPYIARFATGNMNVGALLTKYARTSKQNGIKYYTAKHGK